MCIRKKEQVIPPKENIQTRNYEDKMNRNQTLELIEKTKQKSVSTTTNSVDMTKSKSISMQHVVEKPKSNSEINVELPGKKVEGNVVETPKIMHQIPPSGAPEPRSPIKPMNNVVKTAEENVEIPIPKIYEYHRSKTDENDDGNQLLKLLQHPANYWKYMDMVSIEKCDKISGNYCFQNRHTPNENEWNLFAGHSDNGAVIVEKLM
uniref:Uncharacterized protein n=1 Tax=Panagrolaimus sp. JU765 TaxID=591449 RepID=A0AC34RLS8_9BILA